MHFCSYIRARKSFSLHKS